ncbi:MAG: aspartate/glutamate racemase family protein, partial [Candidatus Bathyarchaeia archaeon]
MRRSLAVLDWGIGGMGFYRAIKARFPRTSILYWSDSGATPYGRMSRTELVSRLQVVSGILQQEGASALVVACNAASTVLAEACLSIPHTGIIEHAVSAVKSSGVSSLGIVGGRRTILS